LQSLLDLGFSLHMNWQVLAYFFLTAAEVMISVTCYEFSYTQAPTYMKSVIMGFYLLSISFGNIITAGVNMLLVHPFFGSLLAGANYFYFFTMMIAVTAFVFVFVSKQYHIKNILQD